MCLCFKFDYCLLLRNRNLSRIQSCLENIDCQPSDATGGSNGTRTPYSRWLSAISNIDGLVYLCSNPDALRGNESRSTYFFCTKTD